MANDLISIEAAWVKGDIGKRDELLRAQNLNLQEFTAQLAAQKKAAWEALNAELPLLLAGATIGERVHAVSDYLLGAPYSLMVDSPTPWASEAIAREQFIRVDCFDCESFVEMTIALAQYKGPANLPNAELYRLLYSLMFAKGTIPSAISRHRFTNAEWIAQNADVVCECTSELPFALGTQSNMLNKAGLLSQQYARINPEARDAALVLGEEYEAIKAWATTAAHLPNSVIYLPIETVIKQYAALESYLLERPKQAYILTVVSDAPHLPRLVGSAYNETHLGILVVDAARKLSYRHATSIGPRALVAI